MTAVIEGTITAVVITVGITLNLLVIFTLISKNKLHEPQFLLYTFLAFWNILDISIVMLPSISTWFTGVWQYGSLFCNVRIMMSILCYYMTFNTMIIIVVDRYLYLKQPLHFNNQTAVYRIWLTLAFLFVLGCLCALTTILLLTSNNIDAQWTAKICTPNVQNKPMRLYYGYGLLTFILLPCLGECWIARKILKVVLYHVNYEMRLHQSHSARHLLVCKNQKIFKAATIIFILSLSDTLIMLPLSVYTGVNLINSKVIASETGYNIMVMIFYSNVALNPLICVTVDARLRSILINMLRSFPKNSPTLKFNKSQANYRNQKKKPKHGIFAMTLTSASVSPSVSQKSINSTQGWLINNCVVMPMDAFLSPNSTTPDTVNNRDLSLCSSSREMVSCCSTEVSEV